MALQCESSKQDDPLKCSQCLQKRLLGLGDALNSSTRKKTVLNMFPSLFWCLYHLILPFPKGPIGNLRSWYKICYFVNCVWKSATFHCYIRFLELPSSTTTSILTGMFQTPHHHETPQENTPPWGQNAQWPPLSWPRLRKFSSPTRNPLKILKKANLKRTHKEATLKTRNFEKGEVVVIWFCRLKMVLSWS